MVKAEWTSADNLTTQNPSSTVWVNVAKIEDAIPIEWIIKWNEDYAPRDYREMTEDMIADWREEQGDDVEG